jgi:two-component system, NtrC family, sensor kinase
MKALGEAAVDLPWLSPCASSLIALARAALPSVWSQVRTDPGLVLLLARVWGTRSHCSLACDADLLQEALTHLTDPGFTRWDKPGAAFVYRTCLRQARLATALAELVPGCDATKAWVGGLLAPLGWLAACAVDPAEVQRALESAQANADPSRWGLDPSPIARRLGTRWHLPAWLRAVLGHLALPADIAETLGADRLLFQVVQLAVLLCRNAAPSLDLPVGASVGELLTALRLDTAQVETIAGEIFQADEPEKTWQAPAEQPLLADLLDLALRNRRQAAPVAEPELHRSIDRLHAALETQAADQDGRLQALKLSALAEFAAGAGHEINNPLAVISGQAQYILKQLQALDGPADEIENAAEFIDHVHTKVVPSLHKIVGQTQRIHAILTDLMQFARPAVPKAQTVSAAAVVRDVLAAVHALGEQRHVRIVCPEPAADLAFRADPVQARTALAALVRNAIEAAPADGWVNVHVERHAAWIEFVVEDSGPGPSTLAREHLFDPFYSGRSAGRGRGLGLPTAWRLARHQGGDVRFEGSIHGLTRFVLSLPAAGVPDAPALNGVHGHHAEPNGALLTEAHA